MRGVKRSGTFATDKVMNKTCHSCLFAAILIRVIRVRTQGRENPENEVARSSKSRYRVSSAARPKKGTVWLRGARNFCGSSLGGNRRFLVFCGN